MMMHFMTEWIYALIYKQQKIDKLNKDSDYNYLEAKYNSQLDQQEQGNTRLKEILLTYYVNK